MKLWKALRRVLTSTGIIQTVYMGGFTAANHSFPLASFAASSEISAVSGEVASSRAQQNHNSIQSPFITML